MIINGRENNIRNGEPWINQRSTTLNERFTYTVKERDEESGYDYVEARYYSSLLGIWLSVDPLVDKYLWITPYAYTLNNPVKYIDPDGNLPQMVVGALVSAGADVAIQVGTKMIVHRSSICCKHNYF